MNPFYSYPMDAEHLFRDAGAVAVTADGYIGTQKDLQANTQKRAAMVINLEAIKVSAGNEAYTFRVVGSQTADRSDARVLGEVTLGDAAAKTIDTADDLVGEQHVILFHTQRGGNMIRYLDLHLDVAGTLPSIQFSAFASIQR